ncbi:hypothetical protein FHG87_025583 [Trinorchestia longiramus]|nr:hypothetical protein FHG87_025583 [Trinorchestia longiramus]
MRSNRKKRNKGEQIEELLWKDFSDGCLSSVRVFGHLLPLAELAGNRSTDGGSNSAGTVTAVQHVSAGCTPPTTCTNVTCTPPLTCGHSWGLSTCGCGAGSELAHDGSVCQDVDECHFNPCLNLGLCVNTQPGQCVNIQYG